MHDSIPLQKTKVFRVKVDLDTGKLFEDLCKNAGTNVNAKLKALVYDSLQGQIKHFLAGKNTITYDKVHNVFLWLVQLDSGQEISILSNLSDQFLIDLHQAIEQALRERNEWIHQTKQGSVGIPTTLVKNHA